MGASYKPLSSRGGTQDLWTCGPQGLREERGEGIRVRETGRGWGWGWGGSCSIHRLLPQSPLGRQSEMRPTPVAAGKRELITLS